MTVQDLIRSGRGLERRVADTETAEPERSINGGEKGQADRRTSVHSNQRGLGWGSPARTLPLNNGDVLTIRPNSPGLE